MVRKQKNTRALIKKRNKQDGGWSIGKFFRSMTWTRSRAVAPTPGERIDPTLKKMIDSENVKIDEQRFFSRIKKILLKSIGKYEVPVVNIEIKKAEQVEDKLIEITPYFKRKLSEFIKSVKKIIIEKYETETDDVLKQTEDLYVVSFSQKEEGVIYDEKQFELLLNNKDFSHVYDSFLVNKLDDEEDNNLYTFSTSSNDIKQFINIKLQDSNDNIIFIRSLNDEAVQRTEKEKSAQENIKAKQLYGETLTIEDIKQSQIYTLNLHLDRFFRSNEYQLSAKKDGDEYPLIIDLNALRSAKNFYLDLYLNILVDYCQELLSLLENNPNFNIDDFKYVLDLKYKYDLVYDLLNENPSICPEYFPDLTNINAIISLLKNSRYQNFINDMEKLCYTEYTYDIFNSLKSIIDSIEDGDSNPLLTKKLLELSKELIKNKENEAYTEIDFNKKKAASSTSGGNHFITLLNHCNLCMKKEKKPVKKPTEKKAVKKPTEKKPVKKPTEKKPVKKPTEKKPTKKQ